MFPISLLCADVCIQLPSHLLALFLLCQLANFFKRTQNGSCVGWDFAIPNAFDRTHVYAIA